jgi:tripartite-type tricarboxylate transporter receptor subunit TctC
MITSTGYFTNEAMVAKLPYDPIKSFIPVAKVGAVQLMLVVPSNSPFNSVKDLIDFAKANPGKVSYASGGNGSSQHLAGSMISTLTGAQLLHVPYKGQVPAAVGTSTGEVNFSFAAITTARPLIQAGKMRILAASGARRSTSYPDIPTVAEAGVPGYDYVANTFFFAPSGTPLHIVQKFSEAIGVVARGTGYKDFTTSIGMEAEFTGHSEWSAIMGAERQRWLQVVRASGAKAE